MARKFIIGDVHGCTDELSDLLELIRPVKDDRFFFLGDLVDKGPHPIRAIRMVRDIIDSFTGSSCICGNHEEKALRFRDKGVFYKRWTELVKNNDWEFLESLPLFLRIDNLFLVHGGLYERYHNLYGRLLETCPKDWRTSTGKQFERMRRIMRVRYVDPAGRMVKLGNEMSIDVRWADAYDGKEGFVLYGHEPQLNGLPYVKDKSIGIDTACVFGGRLTAVEFDDGVPGLPTIRSVPARNKYATWNRYEHADAT